MVEDKSKYLLLDIDDFRRQKVVTAAQGYANQILTLLSLKRGDIPSIPDAYIDISKALRYKDMDLITGGALKERIVDKIRTYLPEVPLDSLTIYCVKYRGQDLVLMDFKLTTEQVITIGAVNSASDSNLVNFKINID